MKKDNEGNRQAHRHSPMEAVVKKKKHHFTEKSFLLILAVVVGLLSGAGAYLLKHIIMLISSTLTSSFSIDSPNYILLLLPIAGILLTGIFTRYILRENIANGTAHLQHDLSARNYALKGNLMYSSIVASSITIGFGGSAGAEDPIAYTGAAIGSNIGRWFKMSPQMLMILIGCGAGAGIAGIFKAPIGGVLFTLEVLKLELTTLSVIALIVACITAAMTAYVLSGFTIDLDYLHYTPIDNELLLFVVALGLFCGIYSAYYSTIMEKMEGFFAKLKNPWVKNIAGGAIISILIFTFPALYGEGYATIGKIINGDAASMLNGSFWAADADKTWVIALMAAGVMLSKCFATSSTNSSGGVGGDFAPTLFAGAFAGYLFAEIANMAFGLNIPSGKFAFLGMAGVMAGAIRAPLMAIFLTVEMTGAYVLFFPVLITAAISYATVTLFSRHSFYTKRAPRHFRLQK